MADWNALFLAVNQALTVSACLRVKHTVTGVDCLLFLAGAIFLLYRMKDVAAARCCTKRGTRTAE